MRVQNIEGQLIDVGDHYVLLYTSFGPLSVAYPFTEEERKQMQKAHTKKVIMDGDMSDGWLVPDKGRVL